MPEIKLDIRVATLVVAANNSLNKNMADYVCDGTADDVEIQAALEAIEATGHAGRVVLLEGDYYITENLVVHGYADLEGQGRNTWLRMTGPNITNCIVLDQHCAVRRLSITGVGTCGTVGARPNGIYCEWRSSILIEDLYISMPFQADDDSAYRQNGIYLYETDRVNILNCEIEYAIRNAVCLLDCLEVSVEGLKTYYTTVSGVHGENSSFQVKGSLFRTDELAIYSLGSDEVRITDNSVQPNKVGIKIEGGRDLVIASNIFSSAPEEAILVAGGQFADLRPQILGNSFFDCGDNSPVHSVIDIGAGIGPSLVAENKLDSCKGNGISVSAARSKIVGNHVTSSGRHGIYVAADGCLVEGNYCVDNSELAANTYDGIFFDEDCYSSTVVGNVCEETNSKQRHGIYMSQFSGYSTIVDNHIIAAVQSGIVLNNCEHSSIRNNYIEYCTGYAIDLSSNSASCTVRENKFVSCGGALTGADATTETHEIYVPVPNPDGNIGDHPAFVLPNNAATAVRFSLNLPLFINTENEIVSAELMLVPGATGNLYRSISSDIGQAGMEVYNFHDWSVALAAVAVTINKMELLDLVPATILQSIAGQDVVGIAFTRDATNELDTVEASCHVIGLRIRYV